MSVPSGGSGPPSDRRATRRASGDRRAERRVDAAPSSEALLRVARNHFLEVSGVSEGFFLAEADHVAETCRQMARRFHRDGRLLVFAWGPAESDGCHAAVQFLHPGLEGRRLLPALVVHDDPTKWIPRMAAPEDIALGIESFPSHGALSRAMAEARERGLLTVLITGADMPGELVEVDHLYSVPSRDGRVVQEVQETLCHILWEHVHLFLERPALL